MKPEYVNTFALRKVVNKEGEVLEITLDASHKYMENNVTVTSNGLENVATPASDQVASLVMNRQAADPDFGWRDLKNRRPAAILHIEPALRHKHMRYYSTPLVRRYTVLSNKRGAVYLNARLLNTSESTIQSSLR